MNTPMQIVLVSGLSGSGKSIAIAVLEDIGFYCVDNLPLAMLQALVEHLTQEGHTRIAIAIDARSGASFAQLPQIADTLRNQGADLRIVFLEAKTAVAGQTFFRNAAPPSALQRHRLAAGMRSSSSANCSPTSRRSGTASTPATSPPRRCGSGSRN